MKRKKIKEITIAINVCLDSHLELMSPMVQLPFSGGGATFSPSWPPFAVVPFAVIAATANKEISFEALIILNFHVIYEGAESPTQ